MLYILIFEVRKPIPKGTTLCQRWRVKAKVKIKFDESTHIFPKIYMIGYTGKERFLLLPLGVSTPMWNIERNIRFNWNLYDHFLIDHWLFLVLKLLFIEPDVLIFLEMVLQHSPATKTKLHVNEIQSYALTTNEIWSSWTGWWPQQRSFAYRNPAWHISFIFFTVDWWQRVHPPCVGNGNISAIALLHTPRLPS